jgi:hypothetical protein
MGTRSVTHIDNDDGNTLLSMYRQMDGYPEGHGLDVARFLQGMILVNGIASYEGKQANGMSCLAAQVVAHFKEGIGGFYIVDSDQEEEYNYVVYFDGDYWTSARECVLKLQCVAGGRLIFDGTPEEWIAKFGKPDGD